VNDEGFIRLSRRAFGHFLWREPREKSRWEAWIDLIQSAAYAPAKVLVEGRCLSVVRGELVASVRFLADRWGWDKNRVVRFLQVLRDERMIETRRETGVNIVKLCKYERYNPTRDTDGTATQTDAGQPRDSDGTNIRKKERKEGQEEGDNDNEKEKDEESPSPGPRNASAMEPRILLPTLDQAMAFATIAGVAPEAAEAWWLECDARPPTPSGQFTDKAGQPIARWQSHLTAYGRKWQANAAQGLPGRGRPSFAAPSRALQPSHASGDDEKL